MNGLSRAGAGGFPISIGVKQYVMEQLRASDFAFIESFMLQDRPNPLVVVAQAREFLEPDEYIELRNQAIQDARKVNRVSQEEVSEFLTTMAGMPVGLYLGIRRTSPGVTLEEIREQFGSLGQEEISILAEQVSRGLGADELGNSTGETLASPTPISPARQETGDTSTDTLPLNSDGLPAS